MKLTYRSLITGVLALGLLVPYAPVFAPLAYAKTQRSFAITSIAATCNNGVPLVNASWSPESGASQYLLERKSPDDTTFEVTGASHATSHVDATWLPGYIPGVYSYRVRGIGVTAPVSVTIPVCPTTPAPAPVSAPAPTNITCNYPNWVGGQQYLGGAIVKYTNGGFYRAKFANPGYDPIISTYFWEVYTCEGVTPAPAPIPTSNTFTITADPSASDVTSSSVFINWTLSAPGTGQVQFGETSTYGRVSAPELSFNYSSHIQQITGLTPGTTYHYRVITKNQSGVQVVSTDRVFTTLPSSTATGDTCNYPNWVGGQQYLGGAIVKYTNGGFYRAKFANPGYDPIISTYFWEVYTCGGVTPAPAPILAPVSALAAGQAIALPGRVVSTYVPLWSGLRITSIPTSYNQLYLFHATPNANGSGAFEFTYGSAVNTVEIQTVRSRGQRVVLTVGGANAGFNFQTRTQSQNFVNSFIAIVNSLGGQLDGIDFNNFEAGISPSATEMVWISQQLKSRYGSNFSVSSPPAPWSAQDLALSKAMVDAGVLDYAGPQFYDDAGLVIPSTIIGYVDKWVAALGDPSKVVVGFGSNYGAGSNMAQVGEAWRTIKQKYPTIRGVFGWSAENDSAAGWTFGTYFLNNK